MVRNQGYQHLCLQFPLGMCHRNGQVVFTWHIIEALHSIVDAVVIHELCYLVHANHSKELPL